MVETQDKFEKEAKLFEERRDRWLVDGKLDEWVAIDGDEEVGFYETLEDAVDAVEDRFGSKPVFIKRITVEDDPEVIQRLGW